jgi:hypothetical protein
MRINTAKDLAAAPGAVREAVKAAGISFEAEAPKAGRSAGLPWVLGPADRDLAFAARLAAERGDLAATVTLLGQLLGL